MVTVALLGTMDTKGAEYEWISRRLVDLGCTPLAINCGVYPPAIPVDIDADELANAAGTSLEALRASGDRGKAMTAMAKGAGIVLARLQEEGRIDGVLALGGSGGSSVAGTAMQALPVGFPKLLVSTMASGDVSPYVGTTDVTLMYSVVDVAGINSISRQVLGNAAAAIAGMAGRPVEKAGSDERPLIAASMFGVTTSCVTAARTRLEELGYEVVVFHATGSGGRSMERLVASGFFSGVLDLTTTELADELVGGVLTAGPDRLEAAGRAAVPQVVSLGALDMVNFGPRSTVPAEFESRHLHVHNDTVTLMRTTKEEMAQLGRIVGEKLTRSASPTTVFIPLKGVSAIDVDGAPFRDEAADEAMFVALREELTGSQVRLVELDNAINDAAFALATADELHRLIQRPN